MPRMCLSWASDPGLLMDVRRNASLPLETAAELDLLRLSDDTLSFSFFS